MRDLPRDANGKLLSYAWPGGYPIIYITHEGDVLCPTCANNEDDQKNLSADVHWEGPPEQCCECCTDIESAYGIPDTD